jgi:DNA/RNA-binding domain of Phe-tRNA-synthetase-like protein
VVWADGVGGPPVSAPPAIVPAALDHPHLAAWRDAFRSFGAKRYRCSAEALIARAGELPSINPLVDRYNAVSMRWAVPVGGEDLDGVVPPVRLIFASGEEPFDGDSAHPRAGEVVWADEVGVTCRRWNWRQGVRTRLTDATTRAYFLFDALPVFSDASLAAAMEDLCGLLRSGWPEARLSSSVVG